MISVNRRTLYGEVFNDVRCLSSDEKPTEGIKNGSTLIEIDTGKRYLYDALSGSWNEFQQGGGGGSYVLPTMSATTKGGAKVGDGLAVSEDVLSATNDMGISGAYVGQTVLVKSVDANGVPTSWEAVTPKARLGTVYGFRIDSSERYSSRLLYKALAQLRFNSPQIHGISARGVDMTLYDPSKHHIQVGQTVRILSEPHGVDTTMTVTSIDLDLDNPSNSRYNMGALGKSVRSRMEDNASDTEYVMDALQKDIRDTIPASMIRRLF